MAEPLHPFTQLQTSQQLVSIHCQKIPPNQVLIYQNPSLHWVFQTQLQMSYLHSGGGGGGGSCNNPHFLLAKGKCDPRGKGMSRDISVPLPFIKNRPGHFRKSSTPPSMNSTSHQTPNRLLHLSYRHQQAGIFLIM